MSKFAIVAPLSVPLATGAIIFAAAGSCDFPFVWAVIGLMAGFYIAVVAFADHGMMREQLAPGPEVGTESRASLALCCSSRIGLSPD